MKRIYYILFALLIPAAALAAGAVNVTVNKTGATSIQVNIPGPQGAPGTVDLSQVVPVAHFTSYSTSRQSEISRKLDIPPTSTSGHMNITANGVTYGRIGDTATNRSTAFGYLALSGTDSGLGRNTAFGASAASLLTTGKYNTAVGFGALSGTTSLYNVAVGYSALSNGSDNSNSVGVGYGSGTGLTSSVNSGNTFVGASTGQAPNQKTDAINTTAIGANAYTTRDNQVVIGDASVTEVTTGAAKIAINNTGGLMVKMINKTGAPSVKGTVVTVYTATAIDAAVSPIVIDIPTPIGVIFEDGIADGSGVWVVVQGIADVYFIGNTARGNLARGFITGDAGYVSGQVLAEAAPTAPFGTDKHFYEIGHVLENRTGAGLAKVVLHFN